MQILRGASRVKAALEVQRKLSGELRSPRAVSGLHSLAELAMNLGTAHGPQPSIQYFLVKRVGETEDRGASAVGPLGFTDDSQQALLACPARALSFERHDVFAQHVRDRRDGESSARYAGDVEQVALPRCQPI